MGWLSDIFGGPEKEKASGNEVFLQNVGEKQIEASQMFEGAHQAVLREANASHHNRFRGRLAGDAWQQLGTGLGSQRLAVGDTRRQGGYEKLATEAVGGSLREGTKRAAKLSDGLIYEGASSRLSNAKASGTSARSEARTVAAEESNKIQLANEWNSQLRDAAVTAATAGINYMAMKPSTPGTTPAPSSEYSPTLASPPNQAALLNGTPQSTQYSPYVRPNPLLNYGS